MGTGASNLNAGVLGVNGGANGGTQSNSITFSGRVVDPTLYVTFADNDTSIGFGARPVTILDSNNASLAGSVVNFTGSGNTRNDGFAAKITGVFGPGKPLTFNYNTGHAGVETVTFTVAAVTFIPCTVSTAYLAQNNPTQLVAGQFGAGAITFTPVGPTSTFSYNAIGLNPLDGYLYGVTLSPAQGNILRIDPTTGAVTNLGPTTPALAVINNNIGAFDPAGRFYVTNSSSTTLNIVDVATLTATTILLTAAPIAGDLTFGPGGFLWGATGVAAPAQSIVRVNVATGVVDFFPAPAAMAVTGGFGSAFTYGNGNIGLVQNTPGLLFQVAIANPASASPTFTVVSSQTAPDSTAADGASCISAPTDLQVVKAGTTQPAPGSPVSWTLTVTNNGPAVSSGWSVNDVVPAGFTAVSATPGCTVTGNTIACTGGTLAVGASAVINVTANAPARKLCLTNTASVVGNEAEPDGPDFVANNTSSLRVCTKAVSKAAVVATSTSWSLGDGLPGTTKIDFTYGLRPLTPLMGDWDGNGTITVGTFELGTFKLNNQNDSSAADITFPFGNPRGYPVAGDFDGNGIDDVAVYRAGLWQVHYLGAGAPGDASFNLGAPFATDIYPNTIPVAGDWDGDGIDGIGTYNLADGTWVLKNTVGAGGPDIGPFVFWGGFGSVPVVGNWAGIGFDTPGYRIGSTWTVRTASVTGGPTTTFIFGVGNSVPFAW